MLVTLLALFSTTLGVNLRFELVDEQATIFNKIKPYLKKYFITIPL